MIYQPRVVYILYIRIVRVALNGVYENVICGYLPLLEKYVESSCHITMKMVIYDLEVVDLYHRQYHV